MAEPLRISWLSAGMDHLPASDDWMDTFERDRIGAMRYTKRREEALLARYTAKETIARALGLAHSPNDLSRITVRNASDGAPEAFVDERDAGVVIAMTDRADWAACAVLHGDVRIGCDLELVEPRSDAFVADYFTPAEQSFTTADLDSHSLRANLVWSAKESALKVLRTGLRRDTRSVEVTVSEQQPTGWSVLEVEADGAVMPGWWVVYGQFVLTCVAAAATAVPQSLVEPPPLASAQPSHGWMDRPLG